MTTIQPSASDPFGPAAAADPELYVDSVRAPGPVCPLGDGHIFLITEYDSLGAALARAETRSFLGALLDRFAGIELLPSTPGDVEHTVMMRGRRRLPLRLITG